MKIIMGKKKNEKKAGKGTEKKGGGKAKSKQFHTK